jgi:hypothetical protein
MHLSSQIQSQWLPQEHVQRQRLRCRLHHLEWHFDGASGKNEYIIFTFQWQLLLKRWVSEPNQIT